MPTSAHPDAHERSSRAAALKEQIYLTFSALAVIVAITSSGDVEAMYAFQILALTTIGMALAMFVADMTSHIVAHESLPTSDDVIHMAVITFGAVSSISVPFALLLIAHFTDLTADMALWWSGAWLLFSLSAMGFVAVRKLKLTNLQKLFVLSAEAGLGALVLVVKLLAYES